MKFSITDLTNFYEATEHAALSAAAKKLQISQPAISLSIFRIEEKLGYQVFYRSKKGVQLTNEGRRFKVKVAGLIGAISELESEKTHSNPFEGLVLTIGCHSVVAQYCLPLALQILRSQAPEYKIKMVHGLSRNILNEIQMGRVDVGVLVNPSRNPDLVIRKVAIDRIGVWRAKNSKKFDTIICEQDLFQTQSILRRWKQSPSRFLQTSSIELACRLVNADLGWGIIPERAVKLSGLDLVLEPQLPRYQDEICIVSRPEFGKTPAENMTLQALKKALQDD